MNPEILIAVCLGVGLSASCGFRVFVPLLATSLGTHFNWIPIGDNFEWMSSMPAIISFGTASLVEMAAYYIPVVDHVLDIIATPLSLAAGALLAVNFLPIQDPMIKWVAGIIVGAGGAGVIQAGTVFTRLLSGKATLTAANPVVTTGENTAAIGSSALMIIIPIIMAIILVIFIVWIMKKIYKNRGRLKLKL